MSLNSNSSGLSDRQYKNKYLLNVMITLVSVESNFKYILCYHQIRIISLLLRTFYPSLKNMKTKLMFVTIRYVRMYIRTYVCEQDIIYRQNSILI